MPEEELSSPPDIPRRRECNPVFHGRFYATSGNDKLNATHPQEGGRIQFVFSPDMKSYEMLNPEWGNFAIISLFRVWFCTVNVPGDMRGNIVQELIC